MAESKPIRCEECGFIIGHLTKTADGSPVEADQGEQLLVGGSVPTGQCFKKLRRTLNV
jgi:hypothetical protein